MMPNEEFLGTLHEFARREQQAFLADLNDLVAIDSGTANQAGVNRVVDWLQARCGRLDWQCERLAAGDYGDCLAVTIQGAGRARLLLVGHTDTVYPDGTAAARPITIEGDVLRGPGTSDMKAGVLAAIYAVRGLQEVGFNDFERLVLFFNGDEEKGSPASRLLYAPLTAGFDGALAFEAGRANGDLVSARKGGGKYTIAVTGRSAHAGVEPEKGANAIVQLARLVDLAAGLNDIRPGVTVNAGVIRGGRLTNVVPDMAEAEFDVRARNAEGADAVHAALTALAGRITVPGTQASVTGGFEGRPMERTPGNAWLAETAAAIGRGLGFVVKDGPMTGGMGDANYLAEGGLPVLDGLGPIGGLDHGPDEYLLISSIAPRIALAAGIIAAACTQLDVLRGFRGQPRG